MGLIDDLRKRRDSWMARFEEHRQESNDDEDLVSHENEEEEIKLRRKMVGIFPKKNGDLNRF